MNCTSIDHLNVDKMFERLTPASKEELAALESMILADGEIHSPIIVWEGEGNKCDSDLITIEYARASEEENTPAMILIRSGATTLFLFKIDTKGKCPDVNMFVKHRYPYQITTELADWEQPVAAISANVSDGDGIHNTTITANLRKGYFTLTTNRQATVKRTVPFVLGTFEYDRAQNTDCPWFCSNTVFVRECVKKGGKNDKVVMHFENQAQPEGHDSSTEGKRIKPILVAYPKVHKADSLVEQFHIFFIASTAQ